MFFWGPDGTGRLVVYYVDNQCFEAGMQEVVQQIVQKMTLSKFMVSPPLHIHQKKRYPSLHFRHVFRKRTANLCSEIID